MGGDVGSSPTMLPERVASSNRKDTASHLKNSTSNCCHPPLQPCQFCGIISFAFGQEGQDDATNEKDSKAYIPKGISMAEEQEEMD